MAYKILGLRESVFNSTGVAPSGSSKSLQALFPKSGQMKSISQATLVLGCQWLDEFEHHFGSCEAAQGGPLSTLQPVRGGILAPT